MALVRWWESSSQNRTPEFLAVARHRIETSSLTLLPIRRDNSGQGMAPDDPGGARPEPVVLRIKLRYPDIDTMIQRFAPNVGKSGMFLPTRAAHPPGTELKFELRLANDKPVLVGMGRVKELRQPDPNNPRVAFGLAVELMRVTRDARDLILKMLERRRQLGLSDVAIPVPNDIEVARRVDVDTSPRIAMPVPPELTNEPAVLTAPRPYRRVTAPPPVAPPTAAVPALAPEPPRKRRVPVGELIESASGPIAATPAAADEDDAIDVGKALVRARTLAGTDLDKELEVLLDTAAAPVAIDVEAASAELARQLGGVPVRRGDRSARARWAPPPAVSEPSAASPAAEIGAAIEALAPSAPQTETAAALDAIAAELAPRSDEPAPDLETKPEPPVEPVEAPAPVAPEAAATAVELPRDEPPEHLPPDEPLPDPEEELGARRDVLPPDDDDGEPPRDETLDTPIRTETRHEVVGRQLIHDNLDPAEFAAAGEPQDDAAHAVDPEHIEDEDEVHDLEAHGFDEVESTVIGESAPEPEPEPDEHEEPDDGGAYTRAAMPVDEYARPPSDFSATADGEGADFVERPSSDYLPTHDGEPPPAQAFDAPSEELDLDHGEHLDEDEIEDLSDELLDDFEILAESDIGDEPGAEELVEPPTVQPGSRPSVSDFALRLDLPEDSEITRPPRPRAESMTDPVERSAGAALAVFSDEDSAVVDRSSGKRRGPRPLYDESASYTVPAEIGKLQPRGLSQFDESDVIALPPSSRSPTPTPAPSESDLDLESALEALDVDLDDLSIPHASTELRREIRNVAERNQKPEPKPKRATTDGGILIDFDDDD